MRVLRRGHLRRAAALPVTLLACAGMLLMNIQPASATLPGPVVVKGEGFDTAALPPTSDMTTWWSATPYIGTGVYLGGDNSGGTNPGHDWLANVMGTGYAVWLYWVGPQSACVTGEPGDITFSNTDNPTGAGETQAKDAVAAAAADGFDNVYIVYDLEGFNTSNSACVTAAELFINGFEYEIHAVEGKHGAVYGSSCASDLAAYTGHSNVPEAIFPADYGYSDYKTTPIQCVPDNDWDHNQRVHQWSGDTSIRALSGHSVPSWNIDEDCLDGPAERTSTLTKTCS